MNLTKHLTARRQWRRVVTFALAYLLMLMGLSSLRFDNSTARAAVQQQTSKHAATIKGKGAQTSAPQAAQPTTKPAKGAQALVVGPDSGRVVPESTSCPNKTPISAGQTLNGTLTTNDCALQLIDNGQVRSDGTVYDEYTFTANAGQQVSISISSTDF